LQFAIGVTVLECSFVKHSHGPLGLKYVVCIAHAVINFNAPYNENTSNTITIVLTLLKSTYTC
jgi:hypothetical protein